MPILVVATANLFDLVADECTSAIVLVDGVDLVVRVRTASRVAVVPRTGAHAFAGDHPVSPMGDPEGHETHHVVCQHEVRDVGEKHCCSSGAPPGDS